MKIGCVIMASGLGKRFGGNKLMASFAGRPMIEKVISAVQPAVDRILVVTRHPEVADYAKHLHCEVILHQLPYRSDTIRLGIEAMKEMDGCFFCPGDQPLLTKTSILALRHALEQQPNQIFSLSYHGYRGAPVLFPSWCFPELAALPDGKGGNVLLKQYPESVSLIEASDASELLDADTPECLHELKALWKQKKPALSSLLEIRPGITSIIGGGGKTSLILTLANELTQKGSVIFTTTTHIYPPEHIPVLDTATEIRQALTQSPLVCVGIPAADGKLTASRIPMNELADMADFVLVEADGSKQLPMKAHAAFEPVIPKESSQTIQVIGADCFGRPIQETVHRPALFCQISGESNESPVTIASVLRVIQTEGLADRIYLNKVETEENWLLAGEFKKQCFLPCTAGSIHKEVYQ